MKVFTADPRREYLRQSVMSASPSELIVMLFDSCIKNMKLAELCYTEKHDIEQTHNYMVKGQAIISELLNCLDMSFELSKQLLDLYNFILGEMRTINAKKDFTDMPQLVSILESMRDTWASVSQEQRGHLGATSYG